MHLLGALQLRQGLIELPGLQQHLAENKNVGDSPRIGRDHVSQNFDGLVSSTHAAVRLSQT